MPRKDFERPMQSPRRWIALIKKLRTEHQVGILEAERIALALPEWRRWVDHQINNDPRCQRMARHHIRQHGDESLFEWRDDRYIAL